MALQQQFLLANSFTSTTIGTLKEIDLLMLKKKHIDSFKGSEVLLETGIGKQLLSIQKQNLET